MKILMVLRAPTGGLWRHAVDLSETLAQRGHELGLAMDGGFSDGQTERGVARLEPVLSLGIHRLAIARQPGFADASAIVRIRRLAERLGVAIVHGHGAKGGAYARFAAFGVKGRVCVYTPHGGVLNYNVGKLSGGLMRKVETMMLGMTDAIAFESDFARRAYFATIGTPPRDWRVIHNGLGPADFAPLEPAPEQFDFAFVGELRSAKGVPVLMTALAETRRPDGKPATLIVAGGGPEEATIHRQVARLGIEERVRFVGVRPAREVFACSDCVVMPSLAESLPYVILEAAATGRHVIATNVGGVGEIFGPYANRLIAASDVEALRTAMTRALTDREEAALEGRELRDYVVGHFNVARMTDQVESLYLKTLETSGR